MLNVIKTCQNYAKYNKARFTRHSVDSISLKWYRYIELQEV